MSNDREKCNRVNVFVLREKVTEFVFDFGYKIVNTN